MKLESLDLHGYIIADGMARFVGQYNHVLASGRADALEVIHGKGNRGDWGGSSGVGGLRDALRDFLRSQGTRIKGFDAELVLRGADYLLDVPGRLVYLHGEDATHNAGCTIIIPRQRISLPREWRKY
jgi:hypothetical protein